MAHWRTMMDSDYLYAADLQGRDQIVTIEKVVPGELIGVGGKATRKPIAHFKGKKKPLALNATNCKTIAMLFGTTDANKWVDRSITLYPTTTKVKGVTEECIRIRPSIPKQGAAPESALPDEPTIPPLGDAP